MFRIVFIVLFLSFTNIIYSQNKNVLNGIFELRLGMSYEELRAVVDTNLLSDKVIKKVDGKTYKNRITEVKLEKYMPPQSVNNSLLDYNNSMVRLEFEFLDNKLYDITIYECSLGIEDLLTQKYGKPKIKTEKETYTEYKTYAERTAEWDRVKSKTTVIKEIEKVWKTNDKNIRCLSSDRGGNGSPMLLLWNDKIQKEILKTGFKEFGEETKIFTDSLFQKIKEEEQKMLDKL